MVARTEPTASSTDTKKLSTRFCVTQPFRIEFRAPPPYDNTISIAGRTIGPAIRRTLSPRTRSWAPQPELRAGGEDHPRREGGRRRRPTELQTLHGRHDHAGQRPALLPCPAEGTLWSGMTLDKLYQAAYDALGMATEAQTSCRRAGNHCFLLPFDLTPLISWKKWERAGPTKWPRRSWSPAADRENGRSGKPIIMSTGTATVGEIDDAVQAARRQAGGNRLLKCTMAYPRRPAK